MRDKEIREGLGDLAHAAEKDHEVQMARADLYKLAKYAIKLHDMLKGVSEAEGLEGWVQSKITKSADMIGSVYHHMDYKESPMAEVSEARDTHCSDACCGSDVKAEDCTCGPNCKGCNCNAVTEAKEEASCGCDSSCSHCGGKHTLSEVGKKCECCGNTVKKVTTEGKYKNDAQRKAVHAAKAKKGYKESLQDKLANKLAEATQTCNECGKTMLTASEKKELAELEEGERHGNSKIYKKCWKGCTKVAGKKRGEPGSCKCD